MKRFEAKPGFALFFSEGYSSAGDSSEKGIVALEAAIVSSVLFTYLISSIFIVSLFFWQGALQTSLTLGIVSALTDNGVNSSPELSEITNPSTSNLDDFCGGYNPGDPGAGNTSQFLNTTLAELESKNTSNNTPIINNTKAPKNKSTSLLNPQFICTSAQYDKKSKKPKLTVAARFFSSNSTFNTQTLTLNASALVGDWTNNNLVTNKVELKYALPSGQSPL